MASTSRKRARKNPTSYKSEIDEYSSVWDIDMGVPVSDPITKDDSALVKIDWRDGFEDAALAGGSRSRECTLILTEGTSAKSFVMTFVSYLGSEKFGVYPLRGKIKNVRNVNPLVSHKLDRDARNIAAALGIRAGKHDYSNLRYGHILLMTDQDIDGVHVKGLLMNLFHRLWPSLLEVEGFLQDFTTALIKATNRQTNEECFFKSLAQQKKWAESLSSSELKKWTMKYYKGLASNSDKEAIQYSNNKEDHLRLFIPCQDDNEKKELDIWMETAFCKHNSDLRKKKLTEAKDDHVINYSEKTTISKYSEEELFVFYREDNRRSIPSIADGLKPSQRKILFYVREIENIDQKVSYLAQKVSEATSYHHGDKVLEKVVIKMAQNFSGSNNLNLLKPNGQFGSRREAGYDHGAARYICTELANISNHLFLEVDNDLVTHRFEDGKWVEPNWYAPIAPLILINGAMGIGTGFCTRIPSFDPIDVIENLRLLMEKKPLKEMVPWYRDFKGKVEPLKNHKGTYLVRAEWQLQGTKLKIFDLPPGIWFDKFEKTLTEMKGKRKIQDYIKVTERGRMRFEIDLIEIMEDSELEKSFGLTKQVSTTNLVLLDALGHVKSYDSIEEVIREFYDIRLHIYIRRKSKLLKGLEDDLKKAASVEHMKIIQQGIDDLKRTLPEELWKQDLQSLEEAWKQDLQSSEEAWNNATKLVAVGHGERDKAGNLIP